MSLYTYIDTPNANLVCCICRAPFTDPTTTPCEHTFCRECILRALTHAPLCPVDRLPLSEGVLVPSGPIIRSLVDELKVECVHRISGCGHICQRQLLPAHLRDDCAYSQLECEEAGCGAVVTRARLMAHRVEAHGCDEEKETSQTENAEGAVGTDSDDNNHVEPASKLKGVESVPAGDQQKTVELLTEQNLLLRHRVDMLEGAMQVMRREMGAVRNALGPWFRMPTQSQSHLQRPHVPQRAEQGISPAVAVLETGAVGSHDSVHESYGMPSSSSVASSAATANSSHQPGVSRLSQQTQGRGQLGLGHRASLSLSGDSGTSGGDGRADSLGEYFPVLSGFGVHPGSGTGGPLPLQMPYGPHGGFMQHQVSGAGGTGLQMNPQAVTRVAPLDLGTNLVGALEGVRESVVGVAAGIDSLERRSEIALANETLRLGEEVISLRAAVHGLRMQIHAMMMERNGQMSGAGEGSGAGSLWMGAAGGMGFGIGAQGTNANPPVVPPRIYPYGGPPSFTKL